MRTSLAVYKTTKFFFKKQKWKEFFIRPGEETPWWGEGTAEGCGRFLRLHSDFVYNIREKNLSGTTSTNVKLEQSKKKKKKKRPRPVLSCVLLLEGNGLKKSYEKNDPITLRPPSKTGAFEVENSEAIPFRAVKHNFDGYEFYGKLPFRKNKKKKTKLWNLQLSFSQLFFRSCFQQDVFFVVLQMSPSRGFPPEGE